MAVLLAVVMAIIPLAIAPGLFFYFDVTPKTAVLLLGTAAALLWWAVRGGQSGFYRASRAARWFTVALCGMALSLMVSTVASTNPVLSLGGSSWRYWGLLTQLAALAFAYLLATSCMRPGWLRIVLRAIAASGLLVAFYGIAQYFGWDPLLDSRGYRAGEGIWAIVRPPSTLGHADYSANYLLFVVFAAMALAAQAVKGAWRWLAWATVTAGSVAIVLSGTRAALLGLIVGQALCLRRPRRPPANLETPRMSWIRPVSRTLAILLASDLFYLSPAGDRLRARVHWAVDEPAGGARLLLWRDSLRMAGARPLAGFGPETFIAHFARYQSADLSRAFPDFYHESPHNILIDALVAQGIAGPALLAMLAAAGCMAAWQLRRDRTAVALAAGLAAMTISQQFTSFTMPTALAYYAAIAMLVSLTAGTNPSPRPVRRRLRMAVAVPIAVLLTLFAVRLTAAETTLAQVQRDLDTSQIGDAVSRYAEYENWRWPFAGADLWYSRRLAQIAGSQAPRIVRMQAFAEAGRAAQRATETGEAKFNTYYNLAAFYAARNDFPRTEASLRAAIAEAPNWFKTHWMLAQVLEAASRMREAQAEAATAVSLDGGKHPEVTSTLARIRAAVAASPASQHK